ncbi:DNA repair protein RadC [Desulfocicer vacuolatum DSM 3385]|uniref:DNA repair protein RadC n=2 Tax=Desulfocicer vacuolatum TaxID=2298 RepID=A0A1W1YJ93_9BACT|nr:DNA repair protein RadC [Desulfocicer vacuolatum DSM 3385]
MMVNMGKETQDNHKGRGHRKRLRERFLKGGLAGFLDYEVIELLLTLNTPRQDCKDRAKALLERFKTLQGVFEANPQELARVKGIGPSNILGLRLIKDVSDRYLASRVIHGEILGNSRELKTYLSHAIGRKNKEVFAGIFLDAKNRVNAMEILFEGTLTMSSVYPREVIVKALEHRAAAIIFAHNHPSGDVSPSPEDIAITKRLVFALRHVGITVHEHMITGGSGFYSFAEQGYIAEFNREFEQNG